MSAHRNMPLSLNMSVMRSMKLGRGKLAWRNQMGSWDAVVSRTVWFWKIFLLSDFTLTFVWNCGLINVVVFATIASYWHIWKLQAVETPTCSPQHQPASDLKVIMLHNAGQTRHNVFKRDKFWILGITLTVTSVYLLILLQVCTKYYMHIDRATVPRILRKSMLISPQSAEVLLSSCLDGFFHGSMGSPINRMGNEGKNSREKFFSRQWTTSTKTLIELGRIPFVILVFILHHWIGMETAMSELSLVINLNEPSLGTYSNYPINPHQLWDNIPCLDSFN